MFSNQDSQVLPGSELTRKTADSLGHQKSLNLLIRTYTGRLFTGRPHRAMFFTCRESWAEQSKHTKKKTVKYWAHAILRAPYLANSGSSSGLLCRELPAVQSSWFCTDQGLLLVRETVVFQTCPPTLPHLTFLLHFIVVMTTTLKGHDHHNLCFLIYFLPWIYLEAALCGWGKGRSPRKRALRGRSVGPFKPPTEWAPESPSSHWELIPHGCPVGPESQKPAFFSFVPRQKDLTLTLVCNTCSAEAFGTFCS